MNPSQRFGSGWRNTLSRRGWPRTVTEIEMDGGSEIYTQLCPFWDGEDGAFDLNTITEAELRQFPNLKHITLMSSKPEQVLPVLERCGIRGRLAVR